MSDYYKTTLEERIERAKKQGLDWTEGCERVYQEQLKARNGS